MAIITLKTEARRGKWGQVVIRDSNGSVTSEFKITEKELSDLHASPNGIPPGVTKEEWESGLAVVLGKDFDVGDVEVDQDGHATIKYAERVEAGRIIESWIELKPGEWTGVPPFITATPGATGDLSATSNVLAVENGVVTTLEVEAL